MGLLLHHNIDYEEKSKGIFASLKEYVHKNEPRWEFNKLGIGATGILLQVLAASVMIAVLGITDGNIWIGFVGLLFAFMANSIVYLQGRILWALLAILSSIIVNILLTVFFLLT